MIGYNIVFSLNLSANCASKISDAKADDEIWGFSIDKKLNKNAALIHNFPSKFIKGNIEVQSSDLEISQ
jgi:hypothetical protein